MPRTTGRIEISATCQGAGDLVVRSETGERLSLFECFDDGVNEYSATAPQPEGAFTVEAPDRLRWIIVVLVATPGR